MDDFGVKYIGRKHLQHLYDALRKETYEIVEDWTGNLYCWNIEMKLQETPCGSCYTSLCQETTHKIQSCCSLKPQHCPYAPNPIKYGKDNQSPSPLDKNPCLNKAQKKCIQQTVCSFLYYARAVDPTILMALLEIALQQALPTENTMEHVNQFF